MKAENKIIQKSFSPTRLAFMRLMKHRLALFGLFLVVAVSTAVVFVPMFYGESPKLTRVWIGANPPGFTHPDCSKNNIFNVGAAAETSASFKGIKELIYETRTLSTKEIRVKLRRGKVNSIAFTDGALLVDELDTSTLNGDLFRLNNDGTLGEQVEQTFSLKKTRRLLRVFLMKAPVF